MFEKLDEISHHPFILELSNALSIKTRNEDKTFFYNILCFTLGEIAASMRASININTIGKIPINIFSIGLCTSGYGKNHSLNIIHENILKYFIQEFEINVFYPNLDLERKKLIVNEIDSNGLSDSEAEKLVNKEIDSYGSYNFKYGTATTPSVRQMYNLLNVAKCGAINIIQDELGDTLLSNEDVLSTFMMMYDVGMLDDKMLKNSGENKRYKSKLGQVPVNLLMFGTPSKVFDGSIVEEKFINRISSGYARRSLFSFGKNKIVKYADDVKNIYHDLINPNLDKSFSKWKNIVLKLANISNLNKCIETSEDIALLDLAYRKFCEERSLDISANKTDVITELNHRYFKVLKLAGAFAFINGENSLNKTTYLQAVKLVEELGENLEIIIKRDPLYVNIAKHIINENSLVSHNDLTNIFIGYRGNKSQKEDIISLSQAWALANNSIIKKVRINNVEFLEASSIKETKLDELIISSSNQLADNYITKLLKYSDLQRLGSFSGWNFCSHGFKNNKRSDENVLDECNLIVLDIDNTATIGIVERLFKDYYYYLYTTKRHHKEDDGISTNILNERFRLIIPMSHTIFLNKEKFKLMMNNIFNILPFSVDLSSNQISKKWLMNKSDYSKLNTGNNLKLFNILKFIPDSTDQIIFNKFIDKYQDMENIEKWFLSQLKEGNRNNILFQYGIYLLDNDFSLKDIKTNLLLMNDKLDNKLAVNEIKNTILKSIENTYYRRKDG